MDPTRTPRPLGETEALKVKGLTVNEATLLHDRTGRLVELFEQLWACKTYRTSYMLQAVIKISTMVLPLFYGPYFVYMARVSDDAQVNIAMLPYAMIFASFVSLLLVALSQLNFRLDHPFRPDIDHMRVAEEMQLCREAFAQVRLEADLALRHFVKSRNFDEAHNFDEDRNFDEARNFDESRNGISTFDNSSGCVLPHPSDENQHKRKANLQSVDISPSPEAQASAVMAASELRRGGSGFEASRGTGSRGTGSRGAGSMGTGSMGTVSRMTIPRGGLWGTSALSIDESISDDQAASDSSGEIHLHHKSPTRDPPLDEVLENDEAPPQQQKEGAEALQQDGVAAGTTEKPKHRRTLSNQGRGRGYVRCAD